MQRALGPPGATRGGRATPALARNLLRVALLQAGTLAFFTFHLDNHHLRAAQLHLPVSYQLLDTKMAFLLRLLNHNEPINQSLISHEQPFTILTGGKRPAVRASVGPFSSLQLVPSSRETWQSEHSFATNEYPRSLGAFILEENVFSQHPELRVLFHLTAGEAGPIEASCVFLMAIHGTEFVRTSCRPSGHTEACLAQLTLPQYWFEHSGLVATNPGSQPSEVEVYYLAQEGLEGNDKVSHALEDCTHSLQNLPQSTGHDSWTSLGRALLLRGRAPEPFIIVKLGHGLVAHIPYHPSNTQEVFMISIITSSNSSIDQFTLRVRGHHGVSILEVVPGSPSGWDIRSQVSNKESFSTAVTQASRRLSFHRDGQGTETVILLTVKMENDTVPRQGRLLWQVYRPGQIAEENTDTIITEMPPSLEGPQFIRAFPAATELMNTAVLTGQLVMVPLRVLAVGPHDLILDVSEKAKCYSTDEGILKVSGGCEAVFVDGSEQSGALHARIHVAYEQLTTSLELNVWFPHLPLLLELSDSQLNPIKGWRVPILAHKRQMHGSENEEVIVEDEEDEVEGQEYEDDEGEKENRSSRGRGCTLQIQHAWVRVWAQFAAHDHGQPVPLLSPDWALDVSDLVRGRLTVEDPKVVELRDGHILVGRASGTTAVQVISPLSDSILGERAVTVRKERVSVSALRVQLISGLSTTVHKSTIDPAVFVATTTAGSVLRAPKQEGILSVWLQFNDGTAAPLEIFNPADYMFSVKFLEPTFVTSEAIDGQVGSPWPRLIAGSKEGGVSLLHVTLGICNVCRKLKRKSMVSSTTVNVTVVFENKTVGQIITSVASSNSTAFVSLQQHNNHAIGAQNGAGNDSEGSGRTDVELQKKIHDGHKLPAKVKDTSTPILDDEHSKPGVTGTNSEDRDLTSVPPHGLSNLHIGMYVLLSVFCFAILLFLANCVAFAVRSRRKPPTRGQDELLNPRPHDWLELAGTPPIEGEGKGCTMASGGTSHGTSGGRNNSSKSGRWPMSRASSSMTRRPGETLQARTEIGTRSPVSQRKQVKFSIFADTHSPQRPGRGHPGRERDIEWICLDTGFREAEGLSRYIHSMVDSS